MRRFLKKALLWFAHIWAGLVVLSIAISIGGTFYTQPFWEAVNWVQTTFRPFNIVNWLLTVAVLSPAFVAYCLSGRIRDTPLPNE